MGYDEAIAYLYGLQKFGIKLGLENPCRLLDRLGNPQNSFDSIHVAGTNGKGSTALAASAVMQGLSHRTGLFTSPHLVSFTERISVDAEHISVDDVATLAAHVSEQAEGINLTFFEAVTAMAFKYFKDKGVRWAVVETGLGGRLDATNVLAPRVSVITSVSMDHAEHLGSTIEEVASEKAGIIKPGVPVVTAPQEEAVMRVISEAADEAGSDLHVAGRDFAFVLKDIGPDGTRFDYSSDSLGMEDIALPPCGPYQATNCSLAVRAVELAAGDEGGLEEAVRGALKGIRFPGRLELINEDPPVYADGSHNPVAAESLAVSWQILMGQQSKPVLVIGVMADKDIDGILSPLLPLASKIIAAAPQYGRAAPAGELRGRVEKLGFKADTASTVAEALEKAMGSGAPVLVTGSFFTAGEAKEALGQGGALGSLGEWQTSRPVQG